MKYFFSLILSLLITFVLSNPPLIFAQEPTEAENSGYSPPQDPVSVTDYWTPERMQDASPLSLPEAPTASSADQSLPPKQIPEIGSPIILTPYLPQAETVTPTLSIQAELPQFYTGTSTTDFVPVDDIPQWPHTAIGKTFFTINDNNFVCSASSITSQGAWGAGNRQTILTAGHCCYLNGSFHDNWLFVPNYNMGSGPYGQWPAKRIFIHESWLANQDLSRDVCVVQAHSGQGIYEGQELHDVVGALGVAFNMNFFQEFAALGYPIPIFGGEKIVRTLSGTLGFDYFGSTNNDFPFSIRIESFLQGGASGGSWLLNYQIQAQSSMTSTTNIINSLSSYRKPGTLELYGPYFDTEVYNLLANVAQADATQEPQRQIYLPIILR